MKKLCVVLICVFLVSCTSNPADNTTADLAASMAPADSINTETEITAAPSPTLSPSPASPSTAPPPSPTPLPSSSPSPTPSPTPTPIPEPDARLSNYEPYQGQTVGFELLWPAQDAVYTLRATHLEEDIIPFETGGGLTALIPVTPSADVGPHRLDVIETLDGAENILFQIEYTVRETEFSRQDLTVTSETAAIYTNENVRSDNEKVYAAKSETNPEPLWDGLFIQPVDGRITTDFGQARYTNGEYTSRHSAFDIAAPEGTGVAAAAGGRVVFAGPLIVSGNAVIIDHGMWLFTSYYHLSAIDVMAGDVVSAGDIIGKVGSTGYSTGPHLHYAATVKLSPVNPDTLKEENPLDFNP